MKAFIFDPLWDDLVREPALKKLAGANIEFIVTKTVAPLSDCKALFEGDEERMLCLNPDYVDWSLKQEDFNDIPNLKVILGAATSTDWIDKAAASELGIPVCNVRNFSSNAVAEWAVLAMFSLARQQPQLIKDGFPLDYDKDYMKYRGIQLQGKTAGIIGLGSIGSAIAKRCAGLGMHVVYWSKNSRSGEYEYKELADLMAGADVIFPIMARNAETQQLLTHELLDAMKTSAILVDMVDEVGKEGSLVDLDYAATKVAKGTLYGLGIEAKPATFSDYEGNVWAVPPYAWTTDESMYGCADLWVDNMVAASQGQFPNKVN